MGYIIAARNRLKMSEQDLRITGGAGLNAQDWTDRVNRVNG